MKKEYIDLELEVISLNVEDVITTSFFDNDGLLDGKKDEWEW